MKRNPVADISPSTRIITSEIQKNVFSRSFHAFIMTLIMFAVLMGFGISQFYETQKEITELKKEYELIQLLLMKLESKK